MKIKKITQSSCDLLYDNVKNNFQTVKDAYHSHPKNFSPLTEGMNKVDGYYSIDDWYFSNRNNQIKLKTDGKGTFDFENSKIIYEMFGDLTPLEANDERLWTRLTHDHFHKYVVKRWMTGKKKSSQTVIDRFFFRGNAQSARARNAIARLWWIAYLTVQKDEDAEDKKWLLTKAMCESQDFITSILERTMGTYSNVRLGVLEYYVENKNDFGSSKSKKIQSLLKDLNNYGGVTLLSLMTKDDIKNLIRELI